MWSRAASRGEGRLVRVAFLHLGNNAYSSGAGWFVDEVDVPGASVAIEAVAGCHP